MVTSAAFQLLTLCPAVQVQLQSFSPSTKGQGADRYGIFGQQPSDASASSSLCDNKENLPEVSQRLEPDWMKAPTMQFCVPNSL